MRFWCFAETKIAPQRNVIRRILLPWFQRFFLIFPRIRQSRKSRAEKMRCLIWPGEKLKKKKLWYKGRILRTFWQISKKVLLPSRYWTVISYLFWYVWRQCIFSVKGRAHDQHLRLRIKIIFFMLAENKQDVTNDVIRRVLTRASENKQSSEKGT